MAAPLDPLTRFLEESTPTDPLTRDEIRARTASGLATAGTGKAVARSLGIDPADASRLRNGDPAKRSVLDLSGEVMWRLGANYPKTTPTPIAVEFMVLSLQSLTTRIDVQTNQARYEWLENQETEAEVEKLRLMRAGGDALALADARQRLAWIQMELAALGRGLAVREED